MASQPILDVPAQPAPALGAYFLLRDGKLTIQLEAGQDGRLPPIATDAATLEAFGYTCLTMACAAQQLEKAPHLSAGRDLPVFSRARLTAEVAR